MTGLAAFKATMWLLWFVARYTHTGGFLTHLAVFGLVSNLTTAEAFNAITILLKISGIIRLLFFAQWTISCQMADFIARVAAAIHGQRALHQLLRIEEVVYVEARLVRLDVAEELASLGETSYYKMASLAKRKKINLMFFVH